MTGCHRSDLTGSAQLHGECREPLGPYRANGAKHSVTSARTVSRLVVDTIAPSRMTLWRFPANRAFGFHDSDTPTKSGLTQCVIAGGASSSWEQDQDTVRIHHALHSTWQVVRSMDARSTRWIRSFQRQSDFVRPHLRAMPAWRSANFFRCFSSNVLALPVVS